MNESVEDNRWSLCSFSSLETMVALFPFSPLSYQLSTHLRQGKATLRFSLPWENQERGDEVKEPTSTQAPPPDRTTWAWWKLDDAEDKIQLAWVPKAGAGSLRDDGQKGEKQVGFFFFIENCMKRVSILSSFIKTSHARNCTLVLSIDFSIPLVLVRVIGELESIPANLGKRQGIPWTGHSQSGGHI